MHIRKFICTFAALMDTNSFTSGPVRPLGLQELGVNRLTDYELLSDSGHNFVYRAQMGGKWVVLKAAKPDEGERTLNCILLEREFEIMNRLDCIYMVQTIALVDDPQLGRAILMEYVNGRPLDKFLAEKPSLTERRRVADELMEALIFLHERQIVHGDLKPSNILITDSGNHVRLIDFGFADNEAFIAKNIGTSPSVSFPEQLPNDVLKPDRDIYALGKMLALLFTSFHHFIIPLITRRCHSVRQVRSALRRYWRMKWLMPLILVVLLLVAAAVLFFPRLAATMQPVETRTDTVIVMVPAKPEVDSVWLNLKQKADNRYKALYRLYADSLKNMPNRNFNDAIAMNSRYANKMIQTRDKLVSAYPQYEEQLFNQHLFVYCRDFKHLSAISQDYPYISVTPKGDTIFIPRKSLQK